MVGNVAMYYFETEAQAAKFTALAPPSIDALPEPLRKDMKGLIPLKNAVTKKLDSFDGRTYAFSVTAAGTDYFLVGMFNLSFLFDSLCVITFRLQLLAWNEVGIA